MFVTDQNTLLPDLYLLEQKIAAPVQKNIVLSFERQLQSFKPLQKVKAGDRVAITGSSRGVKDLPQVLGCLVATLLKTGARPFIAPAMGAQGGATAEGYTDVLAGNGITEDTVGAPILSLSDVVKIGNTKHGFPVYVGKEFVDADHVIVVNRIKPHTDFTGEIESGLLKIMVIGMGKAICALTAHQAIMHYGFQQVMQEFSDVIFDRLPVLAGVGIVENYVHQTAYLELIEPAAFWEEEKQLLKKAKRLVAKIPFNNVDLLIVDEIGKDIAGPGMDTRVIGRVMNIMTREPSQKKFKRIFVRDLTDQSHGNACGIGLADFTTDRLVAKINKEVIKINTVLSCTPEKARIPIPYPSDREGVIAGLYSAGVFQFQDARIVWVKNTLELRQFIISQSLLEEVKANHKLKTVKGPFAFSFDTLGNLPFNLIRKET